MHHVKIYMFISSTRKYISGKQWLLSNLPLCQSPTELGIFVSTDPCVELVKSISIVHYSWLAFYDSYKTTWYIFGRIHKQVKYYNLSNTWIVCLRSHVAISITKTILIPFHKIVQNPKLGRKYTENQLKNEYNLLGVLHKE